MQHLLSFFCLQIQSDRALPSVGQGHRQVHPAAVRADPLRGETPVGIAFETIDANDVGTPVSQEGTSYGNEDPLRGSTTRMPSYAPSAICVGWRQHDDRYHAFGACLIDVIVWPRIPDDRPQTRFFVR